MKEGWSLSFQMEQERFFSLILQLPVDEQFFLEHKFRNLPLKDCNLGQKK